MMLPRKDSTESRRYPVTRPRRWAAWPGVLALVPFAVLLVAFCLAPALWVLVSSFLTADGGWQASAWLDNYREVLSSRFYLLGFVNSLHIALWSSLLGLVIALAAAGSLHKVPGRLRDAVVAFTNMSANLTGVPLAFAFIIIMGANGALTLILRRWGWLDDFNLYSRNGLVLIYTYFQIPLGVLLLYPAFDGLDEEWRQAAALLGARPWQYLFHVVLPVLAPAVIGTFILLLANAMGAYASAYALTTGNFNLVTVRIASLVSGDIFLQPNLAAALSVLLVLLLALIAVVNHALLRRDQEER